MSHARLMIAWALALASTACRQDSEPEAEATPVPHPSADEAKVTDGPSTPTLAAHMQDHFTAANAVRDAVIAGDLDTVRERAQWLSDHVLSETLPPPWVPHIGDMQNAARLAVEAQDVVAAATASSLMAQACGTCHLAVGGPSFTGQSPAEDETSVVADMKRHEWAAERMWEGLIGPSDTAWAAGVAALADAPLHPEAMLTDRSPGVEVVALAARAHEIGAKGRAVREPAARASLYAGFLSTCSACHGALEIDVGRAARRG